MARLEPKVDPVANEIIPCMAFEKSSIKKCLRDFLEFA